MNINSTELGTHGKCLEQLFGKVKANKKEYPPNAAEKPLSQQRRAAMTKLRATHTLHHFLVCVFVSIFIAISVLISLIYVSNLRKITKPAVERFPVYKGDCLNPRAA